MGTYLDCGCYIDESGHRAFCPSCDDAFRNRVDEAIRFTTWVYKQTEFSGRDGATANMWTVGYYDQCGAWYADSDHDNRGSASERAAVLNGYNIDEVMRVQRDFEDAATDLADQRQVNLWLESKIAAFAVPHMALDDENTPAEKYDDLMRDWTVAAHGIVDAYLSLKISDIDRMAATDRKDG